MGYTCFVFLAGKVEGTLSATILASALWDHNNDLAQKAGFNFLEDAKIHMQHIMDIYSQGKEYDTNSNIIGMSGKL